MSSPPPLVVSCGAVGREWELCREGVERWAREAGRPAGSTRVISAPADSGERLGVYQLLLAAASPDIDVFLVDTTWPGMIGDFLVDLRPHAPQGRLETFFPSFLENNTVGGKLVALPWFIDAGLLYYRRDLLERYREKPPGTWEELTRIARRVQTGERERGNGRFWGYVFEGRAYEGLTCNALEWIASAGGGTWVDASGKVTANNPAARRMLELAASWVGEPGISPPGVLNYMEEEARGVFQSGNALFMRNWPYAWRLAQAPDSPVRGKVGVRALPSGGAGAVAALGGWSLAVSRYSRSPEAAAQLVYYLTGAREQKRRALAGGLNPTLPALYRDAELRAAQPIADELLGIFERAVARPSRVTGARYNRVSAEVADRVHAILERKGTAQEQLAALERALLRIGRRGKW